MGNRVLKIRKEDAVLVVIDFQEKLMPVMKNKEELEVSAAKLIKGCRILNVPIIVTQQYTKGLGPTVPELITALTSSIGDDLPVAEFEAVEKTSFSAVGEPTFEETLEKLGKKSVIIAGIEAHICVQQTVIDLLEKGYHVFVVNDCISSRNNNDKKYAQRRMGDAGAIGTTFESLLFELCGGAKETGFKQISTLVK